MRNRSSAYRGPLADLRKLTTAARNAGFADADQLAARIAKTIEAGEQSQSAYEDALSTIDAIRATRSWRWTRPLRLLKGFATQQYSASAAALRQLGRRLPKPIKHVVRQLLGRKATLASILPSSSIARPSQMKDRLVSVVVPNYNHEPFLRQRLESILNQTHTNIEVLFLDDASSDESVRLVESEFSHDARLRIVRNTENSGSPFKQWWKGISLCRSDLVWIAESDDFCDSTFLETILPSFLDDTVMGAVGGISFADSAGRVSGTLETYYESAGFAFGEPSVTSAAELFAGPFARRNLIANASGAVFRKPSLSTQELETLSSFRVCGDWYFYLRSLRGGSLAYVPSANSYFRQHDRNSSTGRSAAYYDEHRRILHAVGETYGISEDLAHDHLALLQEEFVQRFEEDSAIVRPEDVISEKAVGSTRRSGYRILVVSLGFQLGGGEIAPIRLANELHSRGHSVTFCTLSDGDEVPAVRRMLSSGIAVVRRGRQFAKLSEVVREFQIDVVNSHNLAAEIWVQELDDGQVDCRYFVTHHGSYEVSEIDGSHLRDFSRFVDFNFYIADRNLSLFKAHGRFEQDQFARSFNGLAKRTVSAPPALGARADRPFRFALASRAIPEKGWQLALDAFVSMRMKLPLGAELWLVGSGPEHDRLAREQLPAGVRLYGFREDVESILGEADCGLLPTTFSGESFPLAVLECMQAGRPVIASALGSIPEMLNDSEGSAGLLIPVASYAEMVHALSNAMLVVASDHESYANMSINALRMSQKYLIENVADQYEAAFHNVLDKRAASAVVD